jgi:four helix bundle protein
MNMAHAADDITMQASDRLETFGIYQLARQLFDDFWGDSDVLFKDYRGRELSRQQVRSLDSICANIEEGYGRGFDKELPQHLKIARGEARESRGRYERCSRLLPADLVAKRIATLNHIIGGLTNTIRTIESRQHLTSASMAEQPSSSPVTRHPSPVPRHPSPVTRHP